MRKQSKTRAPYKRAQQFHSQAGSPPNKPAARPRIMRYAIQRLGERMVPRIGKLRAVHPATMAATAPTRTTAAHTTRPPSGLKFYSIYNFGIAVSGWGSDGLKHAKRSSVRSPGSRLTPSEKFRAMHPLPGLPANSSVRHVPPLATRLNRLRRQGRLCSLKPPSNNCQGSGQTPFKWEMRAPAFVNADCKRSSQGPTNAAGESAGDSRRVALQFNHPNAASARAYCA